MSLCPHDHINSLNHLFHAPDPTGAHAGADAAADTDVLVRYIFEAAIGTVIAVDRAFRAGFKAHAAVTAGTT